MRETPLGEYQETAEYFENRTKEHRPVPEEYFPVQQEYRSAGSELYSGLESADVRGKNEGKSLGGKLRKMAYLVTTVVAAVALGQAALPKNDGFLINASQYQQVNYGNGGVIPVNDGYTWKLIDYAGNPIDMSQIPENTHYYLATPPNQDGYTVLANFVGQRKYYLLDKTGNLVGQWDDSEDKIRGIFLSDDNILLIERHKGLSEVNYVYRRIDGSVLYESGFHGYYRDSNALIGATPFYHGEAVVYDGRNMLMLNTKGEARELDLSPYAVTDGYDGSGFMVFNGSKCLFVETETGKEYFLGYRFQTEDGSTVRIRRLTGQDFGFVFPYCDYLACDYYTDGGCVFQHSGEYVCVNVKVYEGADQVGISKKCLMNLKQADETDYIALYDNIFFNNRNYLAVCDDKRYFYIDLEGNVVSDTYKKITTFNKNGFAIVMEEPGCAYLINESFQKLDRINGVTDLEPVDKGDVFLVYIDGEPYIYGYLDSPL